MNEENNTVNTAQTSVGVQPVHAAKKPIIVKGIDIRQYTAESIPEDIVDEMTDEQADQFLEGLNEEDTKTFNEKFGYIESMPISEEELAARKAARESLTLSFGQSNSTPAAPAAPQAPAAPVKTEQTGSVIFGQRQ
jgi:hypothetical protein